MLACQFWEMNFLEVIQPTDLNWKYIKKIKLFYFQVVYCHVNRTACIIQYFIPQIPTVSDHWIQGTCRTPTLIGVWKWGHGGFACSTDCLPNAGLTASTCDPILRLHLPHPLGVQIICLGYLWILRNVDKKCFLNLKILKKIKSCSAGYIASYKLKYQSDVIPRSRLRTNICKIWCLNTHFIPSQLIKWNKNG